ncbi:MAG: APC family permease, partial [Phycisphaerales bacterium]|nr:APC family permease [Phycisphaerales bacterium]
LTVEHHFGPDAARVFSVTLGAAFLATVNAFIVTGPRVSFAMARDGLFPAIAGRVHPRTGVPVNAMIAQTVGALVVLYAFEFQQLYQYAAVGLSVFSILVIGALLVLRRRRPDATRPFRVPWSPIVPLLFLLITLFMTVFAFREWTRPSMISVGSILAGIPVYLVWQRLRHDPLS